MGHHTDWQVHETPSFQDSSQWRKTREGAWLTEAIPSLQAGYTITPGHTMAPSTSLAYAISFLQFPFSLYHWLSDGKAE